MGSSVAVSQAFVNLEHQRGAKQVQGSPRIIQRKIEQIHDPVQTVLKSVFMDVEPGSGFILIAHGKFIDPQSMLVYSTVFFVVAADLKNNRMDKYPSRLCFQQSGK